MTASRSACATAIACSVALLGACASTPLRTEATDATSARATSPSSATPVDPASRLPTPMELADSDQGAVTLRTPIGRDVAIKLVRRIVSAVVSRSLESLSHDLQDPIEVLGVDATSYPIPLGQLLFDYSMRARMKPYDQLDLDRVYRSDDVQLYAARELGRAGRPTRPAMMSDDELLIRVRVQTTRVGTDVLFEDELLFVVARVGDQLKVHALTNLIPN
ncbi:MAG: hypothetical protein ACHREM_08560 [Polyangiales bacterium]